MLAAVIHFVSTSLVAGLAWVGALGVAVAIFGIEVPPNDPDEWMSPVGGLALVVGVMVGLSSWIVHRSRWSDGALAGQILCVLFGVMFCMTQIETLFFNSAIQMPWQLIAASTAAGFCLCLVLALMGARLRRRLGPPQGLAPVLRPRGPSLVGRFGALALLYVSLYFLCGYWIAWQFPSVREFYSGSTEIAPFIEHMRGVFSDDPWLAPFQLLRGLAWAGLVMLLGAGLSTESRSERFMLVGLTLSLPLVVPLLIPQGFMPMAVRAGHMGELLLENFVFACVALALLERGPKATG